MIQQPIPSGFREFPLKNGGMVTIRRKEVAEFATADGCVLIKTKSGSVYLVTADYDDVSLWATGEAA